MLRTHWQYDAAGVVDYLSIGDYFSTSPGELLGEGFDHLDMRNMAARDVFECLADNLEPRDRRAAPASRQDGDRVGMDMTFNATKSVGLAREMAGPTTPATRGSSRPTARPWPTRWGSSRTTCRPASGSGGANRNRTTGNIVAYRVTHRDTRINADDQMPDLSLHDHVFILNATYDPVEEKWKAAEMGQIKHDVPYYEAVYHNRLASNLKELGYGIRGRARRSRSRASPTSWSRSSAAGRPYINGVADKLGITKPEVEGEARRDHPPRQGEGDWPTT